MTAKEFENIVLSFLTENSFSKVKNYSLEKEFTVNDEQYFIAKVETANESYWATGNDNDQLFIYLCLSDKDADEIYKFHLEEIAAYKKSAGIEGEPIIL